MHVALRWGGLRGLAWHRIRPRWHDHGRLGMARRDFNVDVVAVVGAVAGDGRHRTIDLAEQGADLGARTWAILASLINTAKLNDLDPQTYLADVLERMISGRTPVNRLEELLAWNWKAARTPPGVRRLIRAGGHTTGPYLTSTP
jgi:IS66 C-terminal element